MTNFVINTTAGISVIHIHLQRENTIYQIILTKKWLGFNPNDLKYHKEEAQESLITSEHDSKPDSSSSQVVINGIIHFVIQFIMPFPDTGIIVLCYLEKCHQYINILQSKIRRKS